jgi:uncharacterized protein YkwD
VASARLIIPAAATVLCLFAALGPAQSPAHFSSHGQGRHLSRCPSKVKVRHGVHYVIRHGHMVRIRCRKHAASRHRSHRRRHSRAHRHRVSHRTAAAGVSQCPDATLMPSDDNLERIRAAVLCLVNHERSTRGLGALAPNARLQQAAQSHTESMAVGNYFEHVGPGGDTPVQRMRASGYIYSSRLGYEVAENLAWGTLWLGSPRAIVASWMASPPHRANILDAHLHDSGIGVSPHVPSSFARGQAGGIYTQDFGVVVGS